MRPSTADQPGEMKLTFRALNPESGKFSDQHSGSACTDMINPAAGAINGVPVTAAFSYLETDRTPLQIDAWDDGATKVTNAGSVGGGNINGAAVANLSVCGEYDFYWDAFDSCVDFVIAREIGRILLGGADPELQMTQSSSHSPKHRLATR
jgi:hypothetical protein